ncbi:MAG: gamma carbonic anhydrase family protein [Azoarcus sp.]|jgi:carbonic anhydrase/acetyltransferase-like protein (isoleucine patch superfamily)|nr:gamma carbonic anhydrase family protein [Azoarcus sp.]
MSIYALDGQQPKIGEGTWIAHNATIIGDVRIGRNVSIWFNVVIRGDNEPIEIGDDTNIQDGSVLHNDIGIPLIIGANVTVGHMAMLHGCTIGNGCLIGINAVVLNNATLGKECLIGANALIPEGKTIPDRSLVVGSPGRILRTLNDEEILLLHGNARHYVDNARRFQSGLRELHSATTYHAHPRP